MRGSKIGNKGVFVKGSADAVPKEFAHGFEAEGFKRHLNGVANVTDAIARDSLLKAFEEGVS